jgi:hypothetical protein
VVESSKELFGLNLGAVYNREQVTDGSEVDDSAEALLGFSFWRFKLGSHSPSVQMSLTTFTDLTGDRRFRATFNFNVNWKVVGDFKFNFQVIDNYDSRPPGEDSNKNNLSVVTSVGYTF